MTQNIVNTDKKNDPAIESQKLKEGKKDGIRKEIEVLLNLLGAKYPNKSMKEIAEIVVDIAEEKSILTKENRSNFEEILHTSKIDFSKIKFEKKDQVFLPPDENRTRKRGRIELYDIEDDIENDIPELIPRTQYALQTLHDMGVNLNKCQFLEGINTNDMRRWLSYRCIIIPESASGKNIFLKKGRVILVCDAANNRTYISHDSTKAEVLIGSKKSQLMNKVDQGSLFDLTWSNKEDWKSFLGQILQSGKPHIHNANTLDLSDKERVSISEIANILQLDRSTITTYIRKIEGGESLLSSLKKGKKSKLPKNIISAIQDLYFKYPEAKEGWKNITQVAQLLGVDRSTILLNLKRLKQEAVGNIIIMRGATRISPHISPELFNLISNETKKRKNPPSSWRSTSSLANQIDLSNSAILSRIKQYGEFGISYNKFYRGEIYCSPEIISKILSCYKING